MAEAHVDKPTFSIGALICDHLLRELPARAQQDVRIEGRPLGEIELVPHLPLRVETLRDRMTHLRSDDELRDRTRAARNPTREIAYRL